jgi:hypothetical protein
VQKGKAKQGRLRTIDDSGAHLNLNSNSRNRKHDGISTMIFIITPPSIQKGKFKFEFKIEKWNSERNQYKVFYINSDVYQMGLIFNLNSNSRSKAPTESI